jgi:hypothetical protein
MNGAETVERIYKFMLHLFRSGFNFPEGFLVQWELAPTLKSDQIRNQGSDNSERTDDRGQ